MSEANYKDTILLPQTDFPMRGDLVKNEPARLERWNKEGLFKKIVDQKKADGAPRFTLHDGPPFANGDVHMGTALNKTLKDLVVKSKTMAGHEVPFVPGWDCHGLPIEFKVMQGAQEESAREVDAAEIRRRCEDFAKGWIDTQKASFRRLGILGDWDNPYLTLDPTYEASVLRLFAKLVEDGRVYQSKKPVQWSYGAQTALAEAEVEYEDKKSIALFVGFPVASEPTLEGSKVVIWTTTPWTLPANLAVAINEQFTYVHGEFSKEAQYRNDEGKMATKTVTDTLLIAKDLLEQFAEKTGFSPSGDLSEIKGKDLLDTKLHHPFLEREVPIIGAGFVTTDSGTGAVHIAPGHGADDYAVGQQNKLGVLSPVDDFGKFTDECGLPDLVGEHVFDCNIPILKILAGKGHLIGKENYHHSYPHCWRSKTPIIFRAVDQFFISMDEPVKRTNERGEELQFDQEPNQIQNANLRAKALAEIDRVQWLPKWGRNRIHGTVEARPDWCISRQRTWGVPLPVFFKEDGAGNKEVILDATIARKVADITEKEGTNAWFEKSNEDWCALLDLPAGTKKGTDTLDVWIDSGTSHVAVMENRDELNVPADLYLEATDQHRGWFQSSLMLSTAWRGHAPYKTVMTHGFVVDQDTGKKTSKSDDKKSGKPTDAAHFYNKYGADIVRLWVSSVDWQTEVPFGENLFKQITEPYRRLRNTFRILLGNLDGFDPAKDSVAKADMTLLDQWILEKTNVLISDCTAAYAVYDFRKVFTLVNQFCTADLSSLYIDITKDRMYCDAATDTRRLAAQTAMHRVFDALVKLMAPILAFTTDEAWEHYQTSRKSADDNRSASPTSIHLEDFPTVTDSETTATEKVEELLKIREIIQQAIEEQVKAKAFNKNNEAHITLTLPANSSVKAELLNREFATEFYIIAELDIVEGGEADTYTATAQKTTYEMCPRCRRYEPRSKSNPDLCERCAKVLE